MWRKYFNQKFPLFEMSRKRKLASFLLHCFVFFLSLSVNTHFGHFPDESPSNNFLFSLKRIRASAIVTAPNTTGPTWWNLISSGHENDAEFDFEDEKHSLTGSILKSLKSI